MVQWGTFAKFNFGIRSVHEDAQANYLSMLQRPSSQADQSAMHTSNHRAGGLEVDIRGLHVHRMDKHLVEIGIGETGRLASHEVAGQPIPSNG